jgi:hypothetical protein
MVSHIYKIIMMQKLKHELGIGNLTLLERRRGCKDISKLVVLPVLVFLFFLIMSCFTPKNRNIFISMIVLVLVKGLALQTNNNYSFTQNASSNNY